ncbi:MAG: dihydroorotate dehydrogenase [Syntrophales bacterium]|jgi:dihydroorotate dehydrogenase (NAD+) catalytic subunit|nr:dihydroorotate dehydrogenase [Syntrophales bacterium]MDY0044320.1 dihydroorotate dehydrogenase [Syntrophales bacterium]
MADTSIFPNTAVNLGGLTLKNPVMTASGTFGYGEEFAGYLDLNRLGAIITKGLSLEPKAGNPPPRIIETAAGMLNAIGLENVGICAFLEKKMPFLSTLNTAVVANILGETPEQYARIAEIIDGKEHIAAIEVNISCPNIKAGGVSFGTDPGLAHEVTSAVREKTSIPLIVKLTPNVTDIRAIARRVEIAGADAVSLINTLMGMSIDIATRRPNLGNVTGGLSGPAIKPVALRLVWETVQEVSIPVIGIGGIASAADALEFLIAGARAVQVGTANFVNPGITVEIIDGIVSYLAQRGINDVNDIIGTLRI